LGSVQNGVSNGSKDTRRTFDPDRIGARNIRTSSRTCWRGTSKLPAARTRNSTSLRVRRTTRSLAGRRRRCNR
jgi:hypothetical protein